MRAAGCIPLARIDDAVRRILRVKAALGLLQGLPGGEAASQDAAAGGRGTIEGGALGTAPRGLLSAEQVAALHGCVGCAAHRQLAREAVRKSLVLLRNLLRNGQPALPLDPAAALYVGGQGAARRATYVTAKVRPAAQRM